MRRDNRPTKPPDRSLMRVSRASGRPATLMSVALRAGAPRAWLQKPTGQRPAVCTLCAHTRPRARNPGVGVHVARLPPSDGSALLVRSHAQAHAQGALRAAIHCARHAPQRLEARQGAAYDNAGWDGVRGAPPRSPAPSRPPRRAAIQFTMAGTPSRHTSSSASAVWHGCDIIGEYIFITRHTARSPLDGRQGRAMTCASSPPCSTRLYVDNCA